MRLLLIFILLPTIELFILLKLADVISGAWTFALVVVTGIIGASLARRQGIGVLRRINQELANNQLPTASLTDGLMILVAAALLVTPGILTDIFGFSLLVPACRQAYRGLFARFFRDHLRTTGTVHFRSTGEWPSGANNVSDDDVIDSHVVSRNNSEGTS